EGRGSVHSKFLRKFELPVVASPSLRRVPRAISPPPPVRSCATLARGLAAGARSQGIIAAGAARPLSTGLNSAMLCHALLASRDPVLNVRDRRADLPAKHPILWPWRRGPSPCR